VDPDAVLLSIAEVDTDEMAMPLLEYCDAKDISALPLLLEVTAPLRVFKAHPPPLSSNGMPSSSYSKASAEGKNIAYASSDPTD